MDDAIGEHTSKRNRMADTALLIVLALAVAALSSAAGLISDARGISPVWLFAFWAAVGFVAALRNSYGFRRLKSPRFA
jgi:hypothetical protein